MLGGRVACAPWGLALPQRQGASSHAVTPGTGWLRASDSDPLQSMPGEMILLAAGARHRLSSDTNGRCAPPALVRYERPVRAVRQSVKERLMPPEADLALGTSGAATTFVCAGFDYDLDVAEPLMPPVIHVPADPVAGRESAAIAELLAMQVGARRPGSRAATA